MMSHKGNFQVYRSSAGSGKTFTLAKFYLALIFNQKSPHYYRHILAITFTVKAATEMKQRILYYLSGFAKPNKRKPDQDVMLKLLVKETGFEPQTLEKKSQTVLNAILHDFNSFSVFTIDKFVHRLVRSFSSELGLNPDFEVEIDQQIVAEQAVTLIINEVGRNPDITRLILEYTKSNISENKSWDVTEPLLSLARSITSEDFFINQQSFKLLSPKEVFEIQERLKDEVRSFKNEIREIGINALNLLRDHEIHVKDLSHTKTGFYSILKSSSLGQVDKIAPITNKNAIKAFNNDAWQSSTKNPAVLQVQDQLRNAMQRLFDLEQKAQHVKLFERVIPQLFKIGLVSEFLVTFSKIKEEDNQQLLSDFYTLIAKRFKGDNAPFIFERLGNRYHHILIDEFQDTSKLQWNALLPLVSNSLAEGHQSLIVGDAKQSIYRFRGSDPEQFVNQPHNNNPSDNLFASEFNLNVLDSNFRSSPTVVNFNNRFFQSLSKSFLKEEYQDYYSDLIQNPVKQDNGSVLIQGIPESDETDFRTLAFESIRTKIDSLLSPQRDSASDICILFHKNSDASFFAGQLIEHGYPVSSDESLLLEKNKQIQLLISVLDAHAKPRDEYALQHLIVRLYWTKKLKSSIHEVSIWAKKNKVSFSELLLHEGIRLSDNCFDQNAFGTLACLCQAFNLNVDDIFVSSLLDFALKFDESTIHLKTSFLDYWHREKARLSIEKNDSHSIQIMTIHKSKGLEFKHVLIYLSPNNKHNPTKSVTWTEIRQIPELSFTMLETAKLKDTILGEHYDEEKDRTNVDIINTLYVAFTRAKISLNIFCKLKSEQLEPNYMRFIKDWDSWDPEKNKLQIT